MKKEYISTGKNVDLAIKNGLLEIGKSREDVDIKILETGGLFKKAKVNLIYEVEELSVNEETETVKEPVIEVKEDEIEPKETQTELIEEEIKEVVTPTETVEPELKVETAVVEETQVSESETKEVEHNSEDEKEEKVRVERLIDMEALKSKVVSFLTGMALKMNLDIQVECEEKDKELNLKVKGENVGKLIGYRGETLNAIQYLLSCLKVREENRVRIYLDIEGYKEKREETLIELANKMADKAEEIERNVHLDPMSAYERRIIHTALQERTKVETESTGEGAKRHVVIKFIR